MATKSSVWGDKVAEPKKPRVGVGRCGSVCQLPKSIEIRRHSLGVVLGGEMRRSCLVCHFFDQTDVRANMKVTKSKWRSRLPRGNNSW